MSINNKKIYTKVVKGYLCAYDNNTKTCIDVMLATGMNIKKWEAFKDKMVGSLDPDRKI